MLAKKILHGRIDRTLGLGSRHESAHSGSAPDMNAVRLGQIVVRDVSETTLRTAFPDCEIAAVGADLQITFELRDLAETYPLLDRVRQTGATLVSLYISL
jgi:hypothetical protein